MLALPGYDQHHMEGQIKSDRRIKPSIIVRPSLKQMLQYQIEMEKSTQRHCSEPIVEMPASPPHEYEETLSEEEDEEEGHEIDDIEDICRGYDMEIDLRSTENSTMSSSPGSDLILILAQNE